LQIFDQREFQNLLVGGLPDDGRDAHEAEFLGGPPAALSGDQLVTHPVAGPADDQRLEDSLGPDRIHQFRQAFLGKDPARLESAGSDVTDAQLLDLFPLVGADLRGVERRLARPQKRSQPPAQRCFGHS